MDGVKANPTSKELSTPVYKLLANVESFQKADSAISKAFVRSMRGKAYGYEPTLDAWCWFLCGWQERHPVETKTVMEHDYPILRDFHNKYGLPQLMRPSCLVCGKPPTDWPPAIQHAELPGIIVCSVCRDAARRASETTVGRHAQIANRVRKIIGLVCNHEGFEDGYIREWLEDAAKRLEATSSETTGDPSADVNSVEYQRGHAAGYAAAQHRRSETSSELPELGFTIDDGELIYVNDRGVPTARPASDEEVRLYALVGKLHGDLLWARAAETDGHHCKPCVCPEEAEFTELPEALRDPIKVLERGRALLDTEPYRLKASEELSFIEGLRRSSRRVSEKTTLPHLDTCGLKYGQNSCTCGAEQTSATFPHWNGRCLVEPLGGRVGDNPRCVKYPDCPCGGPQPEKTPADPEKLGAFRSAVREQVSEPLLRRDNARLYPQVKTVECPDCTGTPDNPMAGGAMCFNEIHFTRNGNG